MPIDDAFYQLLGGGNEDPLGLGPLAPRRPTPPRVPDPRAADPNAPLTAMDLMLSGGSALGQGLSSLGDYALRSTPFAQFMEPQAPAAPEAPAAPPPAGAPGTVPFTGKYKGRLGAPPQTGDAATDYLRGATQPESMDDLKARFGYQDNRESVGPRETMTGFGQTWEKPMGGGGVSMMQGPDPTQLVPPSPYATNEERLDFVNQQRSMSDPFWLARQKAAMDTASAGDKAYAQEEGKLGAIESAHVELLEDKFREVDQLPNTPQEKEAIKHQLFLKFKNEQAQRRMLIAAPRSAETVVVTE